MTTTTATDEQLMVSLAKGDTQALEMLMERYQQDVFRFSLHYLKEVERAKDLTQETFLRVFTASERFDASRKFRPWMLCIARNLCLNDIKRKKIVPMQSLEEYTQRSGEEQRATLGSQSASPAQEAMEDERRAWLMSALDTLPEKTQELIVLRYFEKLSAREIAEIVESTEGAVRTKLHRIMTNLRETYEDEKANW